MIMAHRISTLFAQWAHFGSPVCHRLQPEAPLELQLRFADGVPSIQLQPEPRDVAVLAWEHPTHLFVVVLIANTVAASPLVLELPDIVRRWDLAGQAVAAVLQDG